MTTNAEANAVARGAGAGSAMALWRGRTPRRRLGLQQGTANNPARGRQQKRPQEERREEKEIKKQRREGEGAETFIHTQAGRESRREEQGCENIPTHDACTLPCE